MKKKIGKIILLLVCGVAAYAAISHVVESRRAKQLKQEIADIQRTLREQGFKTELDDFKITTDPAMKARVKTLLALGYEPKLDANDDVPDFWPVITNGTAKVLWKQDALTIGTKSYQWAELRAALDKERERLNAACAAALQGPIQSDMDLAAHVRPWNDHIYFFHRLSWVLGSRALLDLHDGYPGEAWTNLLAATRLVTACKIDPEPVSQLLRSVMADYTFGLTWEALQFNHWPDDRLAELQSEWESVDFLTNLPETMGLARVEDIDTCQKLSALPLSSIFSFWDLEKQAASSREAFYREANYDLEQALYCGNRALRDEKNLLLYFRDRELELRHAIQSPTWAQMRAQPGITNQPPFNSPSPDMQTWVRPDASLAFRLTAPAALAEAERRMLITAIALERYRGKYGAYPDSLAQLTPEFLKAPLPDFMNGQPLRYRPTNDGHFVLYSVGLDCVDDGGKPAPADGPRFFINKNLTLTIVSNVDIVWPTPAAP